MISLNEGEQILWEGKPKGSVLGVWFFTKLIPWLWVVTFLTFALGMTGFGIWLELIQGSKGANPFPWVAVAFKVVAPAAFLVGLLYITVLRRTYRYVVTSQRCVFEGGLLVRRRRSVHYHKVTDVEVSQNILESLLGLGSLKLYTAGTSGLGTYAPWGPWERAEISFEGLADPSQPEQLINQALHRYKATGE